MSFWSSNKRSNCDGKILAYKKNNLCLILSVMNINEECFLIRDIKLLHVTFYRCFDKLSGSRIINEFLKQKFGTVLSQVAFTPNITYKSCYYLWILQPGKFSHVTPSAYFRRVASFRWGTNRFQKFNNYCKVLLRQTLATTRNIVGPTDMLGPTMLRAFAWAFKEARKGF